MKHPFIFCIGFRCGSQSIKAVLERLGYRVYYMGGAVQFYSHLNAWYDHARGHRKADIASLLNGYDAAAGQPCMYFPEDVLAAFPDALVIITTREPSAWFNSFKNFAGGIGNARKFLWFVPRIRAIHRTLKAMVFDGLFAGRIDDQALCVEKLEDLYARVRKLVPPERILIHSINDGWQPLCKFFGFPVPDEPFPHLNRNESTVKRCIGLAVLKDVGLLAIAALIVVTWGLSWISAAALAAEAGAWLLLYRLRRV